MDLTADARRRPGSRGSGSADAAPAAAAELDRFTALAADLLAVPVSLVTTADGDGEHVLSAHGLNGDAESESHLAVCHAILAAGEPLVLPDAAGVPLTLRDGRLTGALCVVDAAPRQFGDRDLRILADLGAAVSALLDLRRAVGRDNLHDGLTGLPNRELTVACCEQLSRVADAGDLIALTIGVEDLGSVSASYGVAAGDRLVAVLAERIAAQLGAEDVLGRLQADTFFVMRPHAGDRLEAIDLAQRIRAAVCTEPVAVCGDELGVSACVGVIRAPAGTDGDGIVDRALQSLGDARARGERVLVAAQDACTMRTARARMRGALAGAVRRGEISVAFQPIVDLTDGHIRGYEALARWHHPVQGLIEPSAFIPVAEETGDIIAIGEHVLQTACRQLATWRAMPHGEQLALTVNFSPVQLAVPNIAQVVAAILVDSGVPPAALTLELTEGMFIASGPMQRHNIDALRTLGVRFAIDDFGTGYSALSYLKRFPVDLIKVDRSFLAGLETDARDVALLRAILSIGAGMELDVVVEGVETHAQHELLRESGACLGQGFLFSEPLPADQVALPAPRRPASLAA